MGFSADRIDRLLRKWLRRLPHPFPPRDRVAGYRYALSILQAEFSLTQVLEEVIRENLDLGRPSQVSWCSTVRSSGAHRVGSAPASSPTASCPRCTSLQKIRIKQYHRGTSASN